VMYEHLGATEPNQPQPPHRGKEETMDSKQAIADIPGIVEKLDELVNIKVIGSEIDSYWNIIAKILLKFKSGERLSAQVYVYLLEDYAALKCAYIFEDAWDRACKFLKSEVTDYESMEPVSVTVEPSNVPKIQSLPDNVTGIKVVYWRNADTAFDVVVELEFEESNKQLVTITASQDEYAILRYVNSEPRNGFSRGLIWLEANEIIKSKVR
jgi:hypothetical protein